jgi:phosphomevalonate kinase
LNALPGIVTSAPGKLVLIGEYAVVAGGRAVAIAVNRRVKIKPAHGSRNEGLIEIATTCAAEHLGSNRNCIWEANSDEFYQESVKYGIGSSAAVCVAVVAAMFNRAGKSIDQNRDDIWRVARQVQRQFQKSAASGIDLAASTFGGAIVLDNSGPGQITSVHLPNNLHWKIIWTKIASSTPELLACVDLFARHNRKDYQILIDGMEQTTGDFISATVKGDVGAILKTVDDYNEKLINFSSVTGAGIFIPEIDEIIAIGKEHGGVAKPSGAGGGDTVLACFDSIEKTKLFTAQISNLGYPLLDLKIDPHGVLIEEGSTKQQ